MLNKKLGFVILNYNGKEVTKNCVNSILNYYPNNIICIVDNYSNDDSVLEFSNKYNCYENIIILKADKNYGFAVGNNIGINFLRELGIEYIGVINNDTVFQKSGILKELDSVSDDVGVVSLELCNSDGTVQEPYCLIKSVYKYYIKVGISNFLYIIKLYPFFKFFKNLIFRKKKTDSSIIDYSQYNYVVSGAGYILTPSFFKSYNQLFNKTFLYCEECILALYLKKANLKTSIILDSKIIHLESKTAGMKMLCYKKVCKIFSSWIKGLKVLTKSSKKIKEKYSNKNYDFEIINQEV